MEKIPPFNLVDRPWIGGVRSSGDVDEFSLRELFAQAPAIRELHDESALVTVSLLRVLLTIVMASDPWRGATKDERQDLWQEWWQARALPFTEIDAYLTKWHRRFELFDEALPWMQTGQLQMKESSPIERLAFEEVLGGVFSFPENSDWHAPSPALAARLILATQNFALGFGKSSVASIGGRAVDPPYSADAPLLRGLTVWHGGANLCETLLLNLAPTALIAEDKPSWELDAPHDLRDELDGKTRRSHPVRGPLDGFTLHARLLRLLPEMRDEHTVVPRVFFTQGRSLGKGEERFSDPMKLYFASREGYLPLALSENKAAWRDSHALFRGAAKRSDTSRGLNAGRWLAQMVDEEQVSPAMLNSIHVVGLATEPGKAGNFLLGRYDRFTVPLALLNDEERIDMIEVALREAEEIGIALGKRFRVVARLFLAPDSDLPLDSKRPKPMQPDKKNVNNLCDAFDPRRAFWPRLEAHFYHYLRALCQSQTPAAVNDDWLDSVEREAKICFNEARAELGQQFRSYRTAAVSDGFFAPARAAQRPRPIARANPATPSVQGTLAF